MARRHRWVIPAKQTRVNSHERCREWGEHDQWSARASIEVDASTGRPFVLHVDVKGWSDDIEELRREALAPANRFLNGDERRFLALLATRPAMGNATRVDGFLLSASTGGVTWERTVAVDVWFKDGKPGPRPPLELPPVPEASTLGVVDEDVVGIWKGLCLDDAAVGELLGSPVPGEHAAANPPPSPTPLDRRWQLHDDWMRCLATGGQVGQLMALATFGPRTRHALSFWFTVTNPTQPGAMLDLYERLISPLVSDEQARCIEQAITNPTDPLAQVPPCGGLNILYSALAGLSITVTAP